MYPTSTPSIETILCCLTAFIDSLLFIAFTILSLGRATTLSNEGIVRVEQINYDSKLADVLAFSTAYITVK
jgi:hypothetical protein